MPESQQSPIAESGDQTGFLFRRFLEGDDLAFTSLYKLHNKKLFIYCANFLHDSEAAKDITHSLWERVIALRVKGEVIGNPAGFFLRSARNLCINYLKRSKFQMRIDEVPLEASETEITEEEELLRLSLEELSEETREMIILHYYSGYSFEEIAVMQGKSPSAVWTRVSRARSQLKQILARKLVDQKLHE